jgi:hypothetical protein
MITSDRLTRAGDVAQRKNTLVKLDEELELQVKACSDLRTLVKGKYTEMHETSEESIARLLPLKRNYESQLKDKGAEIQRVAKPQRDQRQDQHVKQKFAQKTLAKTQPAANWTTECAVLVEKVKNAKDEIAQLDSRIRSATRSSTRAAIRTEEPGFDSEEAKVAIVGEVAETDSDCPAFLAHMWESELGVRKELKKKLRDLERTQIEITEFQKGTVELWNQQKVNALQESRLGVLKSGLANLRAII